MKKLTTSILAVIAGLLLSTGNTYAELTNPVIGDSLGSDADKANEGTTFAEYFIFFWNALISIGAIMVLIFFIWGALEWISSGGDKGKVENARNRITQAFIGLVVLVGSYVIIGFVSEIFFGESFNVLQINIPEPK
ncbi:MAG: hypothetical protein COU63_03685 [Candidatus Pacebacteria bacterium CG10_big_fil_rev_8_21_14_0_10_36_11]|nr:hypothetical protein [Candidatus Pacearchaeota archaeon]OIP73873.1 MAG: hypothetical protein AUK08_04945 [Candidatus Pacebacteria bacterium CG2_30_36_39]PIR64563.1 MAG: hypothetical protein COU63_03685 [Candidatus Pacebacteria bacterium CG10_big_fil_rev_8_21_14_0_10_36_11]PJC42697.1 MAG: hypothetical protein CO040_03130 [Candidatus Pacebacteria bacterium CG_4_9_14_0_2_um_filter_36_8]